MVMLLRWFCKIDGHLIVIASTHLTPKRRKAMISIDIDELGVQPWILWRFLKLWDNHRATHCL